jgi:Fe-S oxidoreductase
MAGTYGHETDNIENSKSIYNMSWQQVVNNPQSSAEILVTGYSCRSQVKRMDDKQLQHPLQMLKKLISAHQ